MRKLTLRWFALLVLRASGNAWGAVMYTVIDLVASAETVELLPSTTAGRSSVGQLQATTTPTPSFTPVAPCKTSVHFPEDRRVPPTELTTAARSWG